MEVHEGITVNTRDGDTIEIVRYADTEENRDLFFVEHFNGERQTTYTQVSIEPELFLGSFGMLRDPDDPAVWYEQGAVCPVPDWFLPMPDFPAFRFRRGAVDQNVAILRDLGILGAVNPGTDAT